MPPPQERRADGEGLDRGGEQAGRARDPRLLRARRVPRGTASTKRWNGWSPISRNAPPSASSTAWWSRLQQHNDFLKTADETIRVINAVGSDWFGCILDIGSLRQGDPYAEIEKVVPYAVSWQIKENVGRNGKEEPTDLAKIKAIIDRSGYRGYVPFEALGAGDPQVKIAAFLEKIRKAFAL